MNDPSDKIAWFQQEILPHRGLLHYRLRRIVPADYDVEDLVAESLARVYAVDDWSRIDNGYAFLVRIARNILIDRARRSAVVSIDFVADLDELQHSVSYEGMLNARDELRRLERIIETLPPQPRRIFMMRRVQGHGIAEIAAMLNLSVSTIEKHLTKALALITRATSTDEDCASERSLQVDNRKTGYRSRSVSTGRTTRSDG